MDSVTQIDIEIIESIRRVFSITKQLPPISSHYLMRQISLADEISQQELAEQLQMKPQSISEHLKKMESAGLVVRRPSQIDKRVSLVSITDAGRQELESLDTRFQMYTEAFLSNFDAAEKQELARLLRKMIETNAGKTTHLTPAPQTHKTYSKATEQPPSNVPEELQGENKLICSCKGRRCVVTWDENGNIDGNFCQIGHDGAVETMRRNQNKN